MKDALPLEFRQLNGIDASFLADFLKAKGWAVHELEHGKGLVFASPADSKGNRIRSTISSASSPDFHFELLRLLRCYSQVMGFNEQEAAQDIIGFKNSQTSSFQATLRIKIGNETQNKIRLSEIESITSCARHALSHAVESELHGSYVYKRKPSRDANTVANNFEFAQTQVGSFILVIKAPEHTAIQSAFRGIEPSLPTEVRGLTRLAEGLRFIHRIGSNLNYEEAKKSTEFGLNANMAKHICDLAKSTKGRPCGLYFHFSDLAPESNIPPQSYYSLDSTTTKNLDTLRHLLVETRRENLALSARIIALHSDNPLNEDEAHKIILEATKEHPKDIAGKRIAMTVSRFDYIRATKAHSKSHEIKISGQFDVSIEGIELVTLESIDFDPKTFSN